MGYPRASIVKQLIYGYADRFAESLAPGTVVSIHDLRQYVKECHSNYGANLHLCALVLRTSTHFRKCDAGRKIVYERI